MLESTGGVTPYPPPNLARSSENSSSQCTAVESFKRSVKRDYSQFVNFKEGNNWDAWRRSTLATARAQGVDNVLYLECTPLTSDGTSSVEEKNKPIQSVLATTFHTARSKKILSEHEEDFDAQLVCRNSHGFHLESFRALVNTSEMLSCMTSSKFEYWKNTTEYFILNWQYQARLHALLVNADSFFQRIKRK